MPSGNLTLVDLAARTGSDALVGLIEDVTTVAPEFQTMPVITRPGTSYKLTRRTALPPSGFRSANEGQAAGKSTYVQETKSMYFLDSQLEVDESIVKGDDRSIGDVLADEASGALESSFITIGSQVFYGVSADAKGFVGLDQQLADDTVYAGGTSSTTSAYLVDLSTRGVHLVVGRDGAIEMPDWMKQRVTDGSGNPYMAYVSNISAYMGLNVGSDQSVFRVRGIDSTNKLTDALGNQCLSNVPLRRRGSNLRWMMNKTAAYTLQLSRSAIGQTQAGGGGAPAFAPMPTELAGIPIILTDSLADTETTTAS